MNTLEVTDNFAMNFSKFCLLIAVVLCVVFNCRASCIVNPYEEDSEYDSKLFIEICSSSERLMNEVFSEGDAK